MKTNKTPKLFVVLQLIYVLFCVLSVSCFAVNRYCDIKLLFSLANILIYGWLLNPAGLVSLVVGIVMLLDSKRNSDDRRVWLRYILFFVFDLVLYMVAGGLTVAFTGGV